MKTKIKIAVIATLGICLRIESQERITTEYEAKNDFIYKNGNIGIGTTNPKHKLDINTGGGNLKTYLYGMEQTVNTRGSWASSFRFRNELDNITAVFGALNGDAYISTGFNIYHDPTGYRNQKLTITANGYVGIGTASPKHMLEINTGEGNLRTYQYGIEQTVNTTGVWTNAFRFRNESNNKSAVFGVLNGDAYISTDVDINQDPTGYKNQKLTISKDGNVGIGCNPGNTTLKVYKEKLPSFELASSVSRLQIGMTTCDWCFANGAKAGDAVLRTLGGNNSTILYIPNDNNDGNSYIGFGDDTNNIWMKVLNNRAVRIDGKLYAQEIRCQTNVWSDFVFDSSYELIPLSEVESFINEFNHLPNVPGEDDVMEKGINIGEMNAILLQKIEELTLYMIEQNKRTEQLEKANKILEEKLNHLSK